MKTEKCVYGTCQGLISHTFWTQKLQHCSDIFFKNDKIQIYQSLRLQNQQMYGNDFKSKELSLESVFKHLLHHALKIQMPINSSSINFEILPIVILNTSGNNFR